MTSHLCLVQCFPHWPLELLKTTCESRSKTEESVNSKVAGMVTCVWFAFPFGDQESMSESTTPPSLQALPHLSGCPWAREKLNSTLNSKLVLRVPSQEKRRGKKVVGRREWRFPTVPEAFIGSNVSRAPKPSGLSRRIKAKGEDYQKTTGEGNSTALQRCLERRRGNEEVRPRSASGRSYIDLP